MMDITQNKLIGLTMELDLKTREYRMLCDKLEEVKKKNINPNDERLNWLKDLFLKNYNEISTITSQLKQLKQYEKLKEYKYNSSENLFGKQKNTKIQTENNKLIERKENVFWKIINKIKNILFKK